MKFKVKKGTHFMGSAEYSAGDVIETNIDLESKFRNKFIRILEDDSETSKESKKEKKSNRRSRRMTNTESDEKKEEDIPIPTKYQIESENEDDDSVNIVNSETGEVLASSIPREEAEETLEELNSEAE